MLSTLRARDEAAHARIASRERLPRLAEPRTQRTPWHAGTAHAVRRRALARAPQRLGTCQQIRDQRRDASGRLRCAPTHRRPGCPGPLDFADDQDTVVSLVSEIADMPLDDGVEFRTGTATSRIIREQALYSGVRIGMDAAISTATVKFRIDINFGDPITPAPGWVTLPPLRAGLEPVRVLGYPVETVLAEKSRRPSSSDQPTPASATTPTSTRPPASTPSTTAQPARRYWHPPPTERFQFSRYPPLSATLQNSGARPTTPTALGSAVSACSFPPTLSHW